MKIGNSGLATSFWNITLLAGASPPPNVYLRNFRPNPKAVDLLNVIREIKGSVLLKKEQPIPLYWQELLKAAAIDQLFYRRNTPVHIGNNVIHPLRLIATCAVHKQPWELSIDDLDLSIRIGKQIQKSGKLSDLVMGVVKNIFDAEHLADRSPLFPTLSSKRLPRLSQRARHTKTKEELRDSLEQRKRADRLPERKAFWELIRIVFTEKPKSFVDELRFIGIKLLLTSGLRIGEGVTIPADWKRIHHFFRTTASNDQLNSFSSMLKLRHFAEKQQTRDCDSTVLMEATQYVPHIFQDVVTESLDRALALTEPLRKTLRQQVETSRMLPWYNINDLVSTIDLYPILTGNPFILSQFDRSDYINKYNENFDTSVFDELIKAQREQLLNKGKRRLDQAIYMYFNRLRDKIVSGETSLNFYRENGALFPISRRLPWKEVYLRIGEIEDHLKKHTPTKLSDIIPVKSSSGDLQSWELLFLIPKRSLPEERNGGLCDITRYMAVSRPDQRFLSLALNHADGPTIFNKYGATDEDKALNLISHSLRHLQNTELFRLGVADTIITKRFNRRNIAQSHIYDHRSLAEDLDQIELPDDFENHLGERASTTAKMILAGKATGPIVDGFKRIQRLKGDDAAFQYLKGEADGFHATPYGHCLNSFLVDPCPKNLECFAGCRHLAASNLTENIIHLEKLEKKYGVAIEKAERMPTGSIGRDNQIKHAKTRLDGIRRLLLTKESSRVFPDGPDLSKAVQRSLFDE